MSTKAISGIGTKFYQWVTAGYWLLVSEINSIDGPSMSRETIDVTSLDSTGGYREFIPSLKTGGTVNLGMNFTRLTYDLFKGGFDSNDARTYCIVLPDASHTMFEFTGLVMELPLGITVDDKITADVTIQITGAPVLRVETDGDIFSDTSDSDAYPGMGESYDSADIPVAIFSQSNDAVEGFPVAFSNLSTGVLSSFLWDFGGGSGVNGATSTDRNPWAMYPSAGTFIVSLTVTGPAGSDTTTLEITVTAS